VPNSTYKRQDARRKLFNFINNMLEAEEFYYKGVDKYFEG
jgi:hypothetical protein